MLPTLSGFLIFACYQIVRFTWRTNGVVTARVELGSGKFRFGYYSSLLACEKSILIIALVSSEL